MVDEEMNKNRRRYVHLSQDMCMTIFIILVLRKPTKQIRVQPHIVRMDCICQVQSVGFGHTLDNGSTHSYTA
jgi:hypothetical protein